MTEISDFCDDIIVVFAAVLNEDIKINQLNSLLEAAQPTSWAPNIAMLMAVMEDRPVEALRIGGDHEFDGVQNVIAGILLECALEMIKEEEDKENL
ncbi:hypothetical protein CRE_22836 [Caenorhabditis remanei]|uniref:Uncharacterized protein n=1 Tax=Caenorhabditis remanei TaxID=31234 RepID=E3MHH1_CAERE|nr:hypothetical protein CRE_22836 [Caenorhabditis remanei]